jgi:hypothetical protein
MKKLLRLLALALPMVLIISNSYAAVKAGSACSKAGSKSVSGGKSYTCVKSGKKLAWDKGVLVPVAKSAPSASAVPVKVSFTPWASSFATEDMTLAALTNTSDFLGEVRPSNAYEIVIDPKVRDSDLEWITRMLDYSNGAFSGIKREKVKVFLGGSQDWSLKTLRDANLWIGDPREPYPCSQGIGDTYCSQDNLVLLIYATANTRFFKWDYGPLSTPAHEIFHTVQAALSAPIVGAGPENALYIPRWLLEGSANFFGYFVSDKLGLGKYEVGRYNQVTINPAYKNLMPLSEYYKFDSDPYGIGQAASEYLIASVGFENFLNIWRYTKSEGSFAKGFRKATGIEIADFYSKFEAARGSMKIGSG